MTFGKRSRIAVAALAAVALVAGCGGPGQGADTQGQSGNATVRLATWAAPSDLALLKQTFAEFTKQSGIKVELVQVPSANYFQKINAQIMSKTLPDIFWCTHLNASPQALGRQGVLYDWAKYENGTAPGAKDTGVDFSKFAPGMLDLFRGPNKELYAIPNEVNTYGFFYNSDAFRAAGLPVPTLDWTWDDLFTAAEKLTVKDGSGKTTRYGVQNAWGLFESPVGASMYSVSNGGQSLAPEHNWIGVEKVAPDPKFLEGATRIHDAIQKGYITGPDFQAPNALGAFANGEIPLLHGGQWFASAFFQAKPKFEWGFLPMPKGTATQVAPAESNGFCSPKELKNPEAAWKVISWMLTDGFNFAYEKSAIAPIAYVPGSQGYFKSLDAGGPAGKIIRTTVEQELNNPTKLGTLFLDPWAAKVGDLDKVWWNPAIGGKKPLEPSIQKWVDGVNNLIAQSQ
jgi:multiple sugar transport system substrate-binding protein